MVCDSCLVEIVAKMKAASKEHNAHAIRVAGVKNLLDLVRRNWCRERGAILEVIATELESDALTYTLDCQKKKESEDGS